MNAQPVGWSSLHTHSEFSELDGLASLDDMAAKAAADGQTFAVLTDHGNMCGAIRWATACKKAGIRAGQGIELYMAPESRHVRQARGKKGADGERGEKNAFHLTVMAQNETGWRNLIRLSSRAFTEGFHSGAGAGGGSPLADWELLAELNEGLIVTTGCLGGHVAGALERGDGAAAIGHVETLLDIFGRERLLVEIQDHGASLPEQRAVNPALLQIAKHYGLLPVATSDSHYTNVTDFHAHDAWLANATAATVHDANRFRFNGDGYHFQTVAEMSHRFAGMPELVSNTLLVAERIDFELKLGELHLPRFPVPEGMGSADDYLARLVAAGAVRRWGAQPSDIVVDRLAYELRTVAAMGMSDYFLIVEDWVSAGRRAGARIGYGRGSAAGCCMAYALGITELDPLVHDLSFERFLNPSRVTLPDFDIDWPPEYLDWAFRYYQTKYGKDRVARIASFGSSGARSAVRDAVRVLGHPYELGDRLAKAMPPRTFGKDLPLRACIELGADDDPDRFAQASGFRDIVAAEPEAQTAVALALAWEGRVRSIKGQHGPGILITPGPLTDYVPIAKRWKKAEDPDEAIVRTQWDHTDCEEAGLLKMDALSLDTLTAIDHTHRWVLARGIDLDARPLPLDDPATYALLQRGDTLGVFQLESGPMQSLLRAVHPTTFAHMGAVRAIYNPGPIEAGAHHAYARRKNGLEDATPFHPAAANALAETFGLMIYQESIGHLARDMAGFDPVEGDSLRKAVGRKLPLLMASFEAKLIAGVIAKGYGEAVGRQLWDLIRAFASYGFNKSHAFSYGLISYHAAYLKANYPVEYLAGKLTAAQSKLDKATPLLAECRRMGIAVLPPDVATSTTEFAPTGNGIRASLSVVKGVGDPIVAHIIAERANGPYSDLANFLLRTAAKLKANHLAALAKAGALDGFGYQRASIAAAAGVLLGRFRAVAAAERGELSLLALPIPALDGWIPPVAQSRAQRLGEEREVLGAYLSDHPLLGIEHWLAGQAPDTTATVLEGEPDIRVALAGVIEHVERRTTRAGQPMANATFTDRDGTTELVIFPKAYQSFGQSLREGAVVRIEGWTKVDRAPGAKPDDEPRVQVAVHKLVVLAVESLDSVTPGAMPVVVPPTKSEVVSSKLVVAPPAVETARPPVTGQLSSVCQLKDSDGKATRTRCGQTGKPEDMRARVTAWSSEISCPDCLALVAARQALAAV